MSYITPEMLKKGYLLFPKALFEEQMKAKRCVVPKISSKRSCWY